MKATLRRLALVSLLAAATACAPGYINAKQLEQREQGPSACKRSCAELDMEMGAFVLVGNAVPGCVCLPKSAKPTASTEGASGSAGGFVVIAAAAAAHQQQQEMQRQMDEQRRRQQQAAHH
jgi:hypothetical protein